MFGFLKARQKKGLIETFPLMPKPSTPSKIRTLNKIKKLNILNVTCHVSCIICHVSCARCHMTFLMCRVSPVTCQLSLTPTATATDPSPSNSRIMHSGLVRKEPKTRRKEKKLCGKSLERQNGKNF